MSTSNKHAPYDPPHDAESLVLTWIRRAREAQIRHYAMADRLSACARYLGLAVIAITALTGTSAFVSLVTLAVSPGLRVVVGLTSMSAAVLASLQTFLRYSERAELHRNAAARYGAVRRRLETIHVDGAREEAMFSIDVVRDELDDIAQNAPHVPRRVMRTP